MADTERTATVCGVTLTAWLASGNGDPHYVWSVETSRDVIVRDHLTRHATLDAAFRAAASAALAWSARFAHAVTGLTG